MEPPKITSPRPLVIGRIADHLTVQRPGHPLRVGIDGITASGKTTFAAELVRAVRDRGRPVVEVSFDDYHHPRERRHRQGRESADGYYEDAYDTEAVRREVLDRLVTEGVYRPRLRDLATDRPVPEELVRVAPQTVVIAAGSFLQRPELASGWDVIVYLDASFEAARARGVARDTELLGGPERAARLFDERYHAACRRYLAEVDPRAHADVVVGHDDPTHPRLLRIADTPFE